MVLNYGYQLLWGKPMPARNNYHLGDGLIIQPTQNDDFGEVYGSHIAQFSDKPRWAI